MFRKHRSPLCHIPAECSGTVFDGLDQPEAGTSRVPLCRRLEQSDECPGRTLQGVPMRRSVVSPPRARWGVVLLVVVLGAAVSRAHAAPQVAAVRVDQTSVVGGAGLVVTVELDAVTSLTGQAVSLAFSNTAVLAGTVPRQITVPRGLRGASFPLATRPTAVPVRVDVTASTRSSTQVAWFTVRRPELQAMALVRVTPFDPGTPPETLFNSVNGGSSVYLDFTLNGDAPPGGLPVTVTFSGAKGVAWCERPYAGSVTYNCAQVPSQRMVTIAAGSRDVRNVLQLDAVREPRSFTIGASAGNALSRSIQITPPRVRFVTIRRSCSVLDDELASLSAGATRVSALVYTTDALPDNGAYASLSISDGGSVAPTVEYTLAGYLSPTGQPCTPPLNAQVSSHCSPLNRINAHVGCADVVIRNFSAGRKTITLTASGGGRSDSAQLVVEGIGSAPPQPQP